MGHVILKEFYVDRQVPYFDDYARRFTDLPFLVTPARARGRHARARRLPARDRPGRGRGEHADWRTVVIDARTRRAGRPERVDRRPLGRGGRGALEPRPRRPASPRSACSGATKRLVEVRLRASTAARRRAGRACDAACRPSASAGRLVTTVFDLMLRALRRRARRPAGRVAGGLRRSLAAAHAGLAAGAHRRRRRPRGAHRA